MRSLLLPFALLPGALARCQWAALRSLTDQFLESIEFGELDPLYAAAPRYLENGAAANISAVPLFKTPLVVAFSRSFIDQEQCATYSEIAITDPKGPHVVGAQLRFNDTFFDPDDLSGGGSLVRPLLVDAVVTTPGDWAFDAARTANVSEAEDWAALAREEQAAPDALRKAADAYLDSLPGGGKAEVVAATCARLDGGTVTAGCEAAAPLRAKSEGRRYVVDEVLGAVNVLTAQGGTTVSYSFRVEGGKLRYVHALASTKGITG
jgi:hypothetical protein